MTNSSGRRRPDVTTVEIIGGPEALEIGLSDYDARWAETYLRHRRRILDALGADVDVEHIGSTSVPGLAAKPIVDIVVAVADITSEEDYLDALLAAGYELRVREPGHRLVRTPGRDVHVHVYERGPRRCTSTSSSVTTCARTRTIAPCTRTSNEPCSSSRGTT